MEYANYDKELLRDVESVGEVAALFLKKLDPEPEYVKRLIKEMLEKLQRGGWVVLEDRGWSKELERKKYILRIAFIHARKGERIAGADLLLELKDNKIIFVQSKRVDSRDRLRFDKFQLYKLLELEFIFQLPYFNREFMQLIEELYYLYRRWLYMCYERRCTPVVPPYPSTLPFCFPLYCPRYRVSFYHLIMPKGKSSVEQKFFHVSEVLYVLGDRKTASKNEFIDYGLEPNEFQELFWKCEIGGPDIDELSKRRMLYLYSLATNRLIVLVNAEMIKTLT
jgi:hypothetical protein